MQVSDNTGDNETLDKRGILNTPNDGHGQILEPH